MDSLEKLTALLDACSELGVDTGPRMIGNLGIIPLSHGMTRSFDFPCFSNIGHYSHIIMHYNPMIILLSHLACLICLQSFDKEKDVNSVRVPSLEMVCKDFHACKWPSDLANEDESIALYFDKLNDKNHDAIEEVKNSSKQILTFSHFVPRKLNKSHAAAWTTY
ncbi:uncharacterized protein LOC120675418 [Panicum virgatum]|uniref:uncharacterized protein LOC120672173 n=1 Tax=Panicum virgatum TaxID=38727 RepID=UPI0019D563A9|nr:uncharacterized protein LOC120672173 [Panicum virgatum]XP_039808405.1 uncharacterized protein LOC120672173 [Panicum virgatum]XP_039812570.1 uncharacterized protein LOC120675418 [Panicum virgatum]XP_039812571.1 uncharacterized protein LOC120675418 [Panicum virgatum]